MDYKSCLVSFKKLARNHDLLNTNKGVGWVGQNFLRVFSWQIGQHLRDHKRIAISPLIFQFCVNEPQSYFIQKVLLNCLKLQNNFCLIIFPLKVWFEVRPIWCKVMRYLKKDAPRSFNRQTAENNSPCNSGVFVKKIGIFVKAVLRGEDRGLLSFNETTLVSTIASENINTK